jgi:recombinational DNA repair protein RecR
MDIRENENRSTNLRFNGKEIQLAVKLLDELHSTIDIIYYLMEQEKEQAFVLMLLTAKDIDLNKLLSKEKRETDILFEIDKEEAIYVMLCQDTKVDGGYHFAERVIRNIKLDEGKDIYCTELEVRATHYSVKHVILKLLETFVKSKQLKQSDEIVFKSLN